MNDLEIHSRELDGLIHIKHGYAFKSEHFVESGNLVVLTPANFQEGGGFKITGKERFYSGRFPDEYILAEGDLIVAMTEQAEGLLGSPAEIPASDTFLHNQRLGLVTVKDSVKLDSHYLRWAFRFKWTRDQIRASSNGAKVRHTSPERIYRVRIPLPKKSTQQKIAAILTAYDDLIENNRHRIALLEKMAEEIYREWFVRLRFPGHEHTPVHKGVPEGWKVRQIGRSFSTFLGGTPDRTVAGYWGGDIPWINSGEVNKSRIFQPSELITEFGLSESAAKLMPAGTVVLAITGATLGQVSRLEIECCANQSVVGIYDATGKYNEWLYFYVSLAIEGIIAFASGGAQQHINKGIVESHKFLCPSESLVEKFRRAVGPILDQTIALERQNVLLSQTRDLLLNRLISGKLRVDDLDIKFPPSMKDAA